MGLQSLSLFRRVTPDAACVDDALAGDAPWIDAAELLVIGQQHDHVGPETGGQVVDVRKKRQPET